MPTPLDRALNSKVSKYDMICETTTCLVTACIWIYLFIYCLRNLFLGFTALVTAATAWSIWGQDMFPKEPDPTGEPETWTDAEMRRWLNNRNLMAGSTATRQELLARVKANMRAPRV